LVHNDTKEDSTDGGNDTTTNAEAKSSTSNIIQQHVCVLIIQQKIIKRSLNWKKGSWELSSHVAESKSFIIKINFKKLHFVRDRIFRTTWFWEVQQLLLRANWYTRLISIYTFFLKIGLHINVSHLVGNLNVWIHFQ